MSSATAGTKPVAVLVDPQWNFQLENFEVERFFEEAKVTDAGIEVLRSRFDRFCTEGEDGLESSFLSPEDFHRMNEHYAICKPHEEEHFFRSMDRTGNRHLCFQDFLMGCSAASPTTPHILNSFTGYVRARYIFDFYNSSRSGTLEYEELARLLCDTRRHLDEDFGTQRDYVSKLAQELGEVSVVTVRVLNASGPLCEVRASTRWTGLRVRREIARQLRVPAEGQELVLGQRAFGEGDVLDSLVPAGATSAAVRLMNSSWDQWPSTPEPSASDGVVGLERLVHVSFQRLYRAVVGEQLRGTSRLFRFHRSILQSKRGAVGGA